MNSRIFMIVTISIILLVLCFFTARMYITGFRLSSHPARNVMISALFLPILYIGSLIGTRSAKWISGIPYLIINVLAGIFFYLILGAIVLGVIDVGFLVGHAIMPTSIPWTILVLSLLAATISFIQARFFVLRKYTVILPGAPASWHGKTAVMVSDTHFGLVNYKRFSDKVVNKILSLKPDMVFHAGDFYDGPLVDVAPLTASWQKLTAQVPLFYTPGNHEAYGDYKLFVDSVRAAGATVLDDRFVEHEGVQIAGTLYHSGKESSDVVSMVKGLPLDANKATILINHPPTSLHGVSEAGVNLMLSGHTHRGQTWPFRYITKKVYHGYDYGMKKFNDMSVITSKGIGTFGPPMRLFNSPEVVHITFKTTK